DGGRVAFTSTRDGVIQVILADVDAQTEVVLSSGPGGVAGDHDSLEPAISADGRTVAFRSAATNLVDGDRNRSDDIFVYDGGAAPPPRAGVSVGPHGEQGDGDSTDPSLSADGRFLAFASRAGNLVAGDTNHAIDVFVLDRVTGVTTRASVGSHGEEAN